MILHYLKIAWRNIWNDKFYSLINLIGLTVAFTIVFLFIMWIKQELSFEAHNPYANRIYQVQEVEKRADGYYRSMWTGGDIIKMKEKYPIIEEIASFDCYAHSMVIDDVAVMNDVAVMYEDAKGSLDFLKVFPMECIAGTTENLESDRFGIFISEEAAYKFYGSPEKAIGKEKKSRLQGGTIQGVLRVPKQSIIQFDLLTIADHRLAYNYIKLKENVRFTKEQQLSMANFLTENYGSDRKLVFEPIKKLHLHTNSDTQKPLYNNIYFGSIQEIRLFILVVVLIMLLAIINYINTSTARSMSRVKEVGVRKISGSSRRELITRFLIEAFIISFIAVFLAVDFAKLLHHPFERVMGNTFQFRIDLQTIFIALSICIITAILAGSYASFYLSSLNPVNVLSGNIGSGKSKNIFRKTLLTIQFAIAIAILISTWTVYRQVNYMLNKDLGFNMEGVYSFDTSLMYQSDDFTKELQTSPYVANATMAMNPPYNVIYGYSGVSWQGSSQAVEDIRFAQIFCDHRFAETFGLEVVQGEFIPPGLSWWGDVNEDSYNIVINETFRKLIGVENPVGMTISYGGGHGKILGVVKDFYFQPMNYEIVPLIMSINPEATTKMYIKTDPKHPKEALAHIRATYDKMREDIILLSTRPFILKPLEAEYREMYKSETRLQKILGVFSILSIALSFLGIISMVTFMIEKRTKEIGIRKINGASWLDIVKEFWRDFLSLIGIATIPAIIVAFWLIHRWLEQYVYRATFGWWIFAIVPIIITGITALILLVQVQSIARKNPVESLKSE